MTRPAWDHIAAVGLLLLGGAAAALAVGQLLRSREPWWPARLRHLVDALGTALVSGVGATTLAADQPAFRPLVAGLVVVATASLVLRVIPDTGDAAASRS